MKEGHKATKSLRQKRGEWFDVVKFLTGITIRSDMQSVPATVMLIDDDATLAGATMQSLHAVRGVRQIIWLKDAASTLEYLRHISSNRLCGVGVYPQLILLSVDLAHGRGVDLLRQLKGNLLTRRIPVIMLARVSDNERLASCYAGGANSIIIRPVTVSELKERFAELGLLWALTRKLPPVVGAL